MADVLFVAITIAFFAVAMGAVKLCDRIIGPDADAASEWDGAESDRGRGAPAPDEYAEPVDDETLTASGASR
jgi:hypothetical protein